MGGDLFTVNRLIPAAAVLGPRSPQRLLSVLRGIVRDIRRVNPKMAEYHLYDISFQRRDNKIDIKLYFHGEGLQDGRTAGESEAVAQAVAEAVAQAVAEPVTQPVTQAPLPR
ncbi:MAG TPA: hypothetical protein VGL40_03235 [Bacillota bacterium]